MARSASERIQRRDVHTSHKSDLFDSPMARFRNNPIKNRMQPPKNTNLGFKPKANYILALGAILILQQASKANTDVSEAVDFNRDIRPILSNNCFFCHGPDGETREADLRLDIREDALEAFAFVPGDPEESELVYRILSEDSDEVMPPPSSNKSLSNDERELLQRWIAEGAEYEKHWAYTPIERPALDGIDAIVAKRLKQNDLGFSPEASKTTLIRRLSFDLTGLPPKPEAVQAFVQDKDPKAYEKLVDELLASKHYGEKMAIHWLDAVRYADTVGYHGDQQRDATPFRDYVIEAFNDNKPFDQFTIEQIAGDLLPNPSVKQLVAASYNRLNQISREGGIQDKEYVKKYQSERVRTTATNWLGSTMACAECHDHKFDPFTAKDFYSFAAFFSDILEKGAYTDDGDYQEDPYQYIANDGSMHTGWFGPELTVPNYIFHENPEAVKEEIRKREAVLAKGSVEADREFAKWIALQDRLSKRNIPSYFPLQYTSEHQDTTTGESIDLSHYPYELVHTAALEFDARIDGGGGRGSLGIELTYEVDGEDKKKAYHLGDNYEKELDSKSKAPAVQLTPLLYKGVWHPISITMAQLDLPVEAKLVSILPLKGNRGGFRAFRLRTMREGSPYKLLDKDLQNALKQVISKPDTPNGEDDLRRAFYVDHAETFAAERQEINKLKKELYGDRYTPLTVSAAPREVKVLPRGNWMDDSGETVSPATPTFLPHAIASDESRRLNRLDLAKWIVHPENPLTARAFTNRLWALYFGTPLSSAPEDLGLQGEYPPYPELLDWLASEFIESGWDIKHVVREIVLSRTYRQSSDAPQKLFDKDPYNRLLARQSAVRLPAELIRDNALSISGLLNPKMGGLSARPYQPEGHYRNLNFPKVAYNHDTDQDQYRRGVYMHWQRTFLHPMLTTFDAGGRDECIIQRELSNSPLQALTLLNDPTQVEAARALAEILMAEKNDNARIESAYERALARKPTAKERRTLKAFLQRERTRFGNESNQADPFLEVGLHSPDEELDPAELAALTSLSRAILNLHETITRY